MTNTAKPQLSSPMQAWARAETANVVVCRDAEVASVDGDGRVSVRSLTPMQEVVAGVPRWVPMPLLPRIPVAYVGSGDTQDTFPVSVGTRGLVLIRDVSSTEVDAGNVGTEQVEPTDERRWDPVDAVFLPMQLGGTTLPSIAIPSSGRALLVKVGEVLHLGAINGSGRFPLVAELVTRINLLEQNINAVALTAGLPVPYLGPVTPTAGEPVTTAAGIRSDRVRVDG